MAKKLGRHSVGDGLLLNVGQSGGCSWTCRVRTPSGIRRDMGVGSYPEVTLAEARTRSAEMRRQVRDGLDPLTEKKKARQRALTFREAAEECWGERRPGFRNPKHGMQWIQTLRTYAFPKVGHLPVADLHHSDVIDVLRPIWLEKKETARRVLQRVAEVVNWSIGRGLREHELPKTVIRTALGRQKLKSRHFAAVPVEEAPAIYAQVKASGSISGEALRLQILTALRPGVARQARWADFDLKHGLWVIPAELMKAGEEHVVALSKEAVTLVQAMPRVAGSEYVFPGLNKKKAISDTSVSNVQKAIIKGVTMHGWRSTFEDWAAENTNFKQHVIDAAMAHKVDDEVKAAYRRTKFLDQRAELMQVWANFLEGRIAIVSRLDAAYRQKKAAAG